MSGKMKPRHLLTYAVHSGSLVLVKNDLITSHHSGYFKHGSVEIAESKRAYTVGAPMILCVPENYHRFNTFEWRPVDVMSAFLAFGANGGFRAKSCQGLLMFEGTFTVASFDPYDQSMELLFSCNIERGMNVCHVSDLTVYSRDILRQFRRRKTVDQFGLPVTRGGLSTLPPISQLNQFEQTHRMAHETFMNKMAGVTTRGAVGRKPGSSVGLYMCEGRQLSVWAVGVSA